MFLGGDENMNNKPWHVKRYVYVKAYACIGWWTVYNVVLDCVVET